NGRNEENNNSPSCSHSISCELGEQNNIVSISDQRRDDGIRVDNELSLLHVGSRRADSMHESDHTCSSSPGRSLAVDQMSNIHNTSLRQGDLYSTHTLYFEPDMLSVRASPTNNSMTTASSNAVVISRRVLPPLSEAFPRRLTGRTPEVIQLALSNIIDNIRSIVSGSHDPSNLETQLPPSLSCILYHHLTLSRIPRSLSDIVQSSFLPVNGLTTPSSENAPALQLGEVASTSDEIGIQNEFDILSQQYLQSMAFLHRLAGGLLEGSILFRMLTGGGGGQFRLSSEDNLILSQPPLLDIANFYDRYGDMRVDVDNMSYEELLALEDRIGNVNTGLSEEAITRFLKQSTYFLLLEENSTKDACSICQEEYLEDDEMGKLDCGHAFHATCIKQWLRCKNLCPVCKSTGLTLCDPNMFRNS
ncbi:PREDICTED: E3 ubiquitin-protein ligase MBR1-like, partial [Nelumbo nucifera]|uniref:RING-type E3 ubiquitin transferase n=1 Tax=Nelumbo nucifera TaxID=4432 RepID=A0A1U7ZP39_NELNU